ALLLAGEVRGQGQRLAVPGCGDRLLVIGELAANAGRIGHQERAAERKRVVATLVRRIAAAQLRLRFTQRWREEDVGRALDGKIRGDLKEIHAASGNDGCGEEFRRL